MRSRAGTLARGVAGVLLAATAVGAPLALGTVHEAVRAVVFVACALALVAMLVERVRAGRRFPLTVPLVALGVAVLATGLQLVPLPPAIVAALSPLAGETYDLAGDAARWRPLTLDPAATMAELAKLGAYLAFFAAATAYTSRPERRRHLVFAVTGAATLVAVVGLVQAGLGVRDILGFYRPVAEWGPFVRGTFVNPNHFGALLCLGAPCALTLALQERRWRWPAFAATFLMDVAVVLSLARASIVAAFLGQGLAFVLDQVQLRRGSDGDGATRRGRGRGGVIALAIVAVTASVGVALAFGRSRLAPEVARTVGLEDLRDPLSKLRVWERSSELVMAYPWTGVGRGAFEPAFTRVSSVGGYVRYEWAENGYVEAVVDWGVPVAILLFLLAGWSLALALRRLRDDPLAVGALAAIVALAVHEAADYAVEIPGVALPALALLATVFCRSGGETTTRFRIGWLLVPLPLAFLVPLGLELRMPSAAADGARLMAVARDPGIKADDVVTAGALAAARHPSDFFVRALVAERLVRDKDARAIRWLNEAMYLNPTHPGPHLMAAEVLAASGHKLQALVEYRLAAAGAPDPRSGVFDYVAARYPKLEDLVAATPDDVRGGNALAKWLLARNRPADAERVYARVVELDPTQVRALAMLADLAIRRQDAAAATRWVQALLLVDPEHGHGRAAMRLAIEERLLAGDLDGAIRLADASDTRGGEALDGELKLASALVAAGRSDEARARLDRVAARALDRRDAARVHEVRAEIERRAGNEHQYQWEMGERARLLGSP